MKRETGDISARERLPFRVKTEDLNGIEKKTLTGQPADAECGVDLSDQRWRKPRVPKDILFLFGGLAEPTGAVNNELLSYDCRARRWRKIPRPHAAPSVGGFSGLEFLDTVERYDPSAANVWTIVSVMPQPRSGAQVLAEEGILYVVGGFNGTELLNSGSSPCLHTESSPSIQNSDLSYAMSGVVALALMLVGIGLVVALNILRQRRDTSGSTCTTQSCLRHQEILADSVDNDTAPCINFYQHVCGRWTKSHNLSVEEVALKSIMLEGVKVLNMPVDLGSHVAHKSINFFQACTSVLNASNVPGIKTGRITHHLRTTYEAFTPVNESRLGEIVERFKSAEEFLDAHVGDSRWRPNSSEVLQYNKSLFLSLTEPVNHSRWDVMFQRYLNTTIDGVIIQVSSPLYLHALFQLAQTKGEIAINDYVATLCVQRLVHYSSPVILQSLYGSSEAAVEAVNSHCFDSTVMFYGYDVNNILLANRPLHLEMLKRLANDIDNRLLVAINFTNDNTSAPQKKNHADNTEGFGSHVRRVFEVLDMSKAEAYPRFYGGYPNVVSNPLRNRQNMFEHIKRLRMRGGFVWGSRIHRTFSTVQNFKLMIQHLDFPFFAPDAHRGAVLGGLGTRFAAAAFYDMVEGHGDDFKPLYERYKDCLSIVHTNLSSMDIQGAVAAIPVAWSVFSQAMNAAEDTLVKDMRPFSASEVFFLLGCYLLCGEPNGEVLCNEPLRQSVDFSRVYSCPVGSAMNPGKKCALVNK
ncbi:hypothetical protein HPB48_014703 [Haemaphysalis longicornis]|uniref:Uncharacterized protein n=1 Tax=Haemaphysalis longicornis TaxID=44386 RepID=A0A9J6GBE9_HAELO|nr:hypothetical protein HPB48_014703 [Haemaphysalis longicornis]